MLWGSVDLLFLSAIRKKKKQKDELLRTYPKKSAGSRSEAKIFTLFLKKKNSLRSNSFLFLTLRKAPPLHAQKVRPDIRRNIALLVGVGVFSLILCYIHSRTNQPPTSEAMLRRLSGLTF